MALVTDLPDELATCLGRYRKHFGAPAFRHFQTYVCGLIVAENLTVEGINRAFLQRRHPSSLNRFLTWSIWGPDDVNDARLEALKAEGGLQGKGWLVIDDTLTHKTGKAIEAVRIYKDHCENRYVLAHNLVTTLFIKRDGTVHPLHFRLYLKEDYCNEKGVPFKTKIDDNEELQGEPAYFATDNLQWESSRILTTYARRSKIEGFYRDAKQNLGLEDYQLRDLRGIKRHWCLVFLAYSLLVRGLRDTH